MKNFAIIGGGIGGLTLAIAMQRKGFHVKVYEGAPEFKPLGAGLALTANSVKAYAEIGIDKDVISVGKKLKHTFGKDHRGKIISHANIEELTLRFGILSSFTIHRADLHQILASLIPNGTIQLRKAVTNIDQDAQSVTIDFSDGTRERADYAIACDGVHSVIRQKLLPQTKPRYAGYTCWRAVIDNLPPGFNSEEMSETWGPGRRFGVVPLTNHRVYWFATLNAKENDAVMRDTKVSDLRIYFRYFHFPIPEILANTKEEQLIWSDIIDIEPLRQFAFGKIVLMGDAAHATTPNLGQGACMAIEDAATLANALVKYGPEEAFRRFESHRIKRTTNIVNQSWGFGRIAQLENSLLMALRNAAFRKVPQRIIYKQLKALYDVSFNP